MLGIQVENSLHVSRRLLQRGYLALPAGKQAEVLGLTPPACLTGAQVDGFVAALTDVA
jgi:4-aminobutyrate aminotransferase-like enzyme